MTILWLYKGALKRHYMMSAENKHFAMTMYQKQATWVKSWNKQDVTRVIPYVRGHRVAYVKEMVFANELLARHYVDRYTKLMLAIRGRVKQKILQ